ncbi:MAG: hypothetical protein Q9166_007944 [cf. Caloplaca sp. 2 TL-2023]
MAVSEDADKARIILEAVQLAASTKIASLQQLIAREPEVLQLELVLRILLTYLPESIEPNLYIDLLQQFADGTVHEPSHPSLRPAQRRKELSDDDARHQVRQLHLLPVAEEQDLQAGCTDQISLFLIHRARKIDVETGSISKVQELLEPFLDRDPYLRTWTISNILPLRRIHYEYYPQVDDTYTLEAFEKLEGRPAIDTLLSRSARTGNDEPIQSARDLRGIVGPWIYGERSRKRRKTRHDRRRGSIQISKPTEPDTVTKEEARHKGWFDVNEWITDLALRDFSTAADTIEQWDGPDDVDYGGYNDDQELDDDMSGTLNQRFAQAGLAAVYVTSELSTSTFAKSHGILSKAARLLGLRNPPALDKPQGFDESYLSKDYVDMFSEIHLLHNALLKPDNPLTSPGNPSLAFADLMLRSCVLLQRLGHAKPCRVVAGLAAFGRHEDQTEELHKTLQKIPIRTRDNGSWAEVRHQILWLRDWQYQASEIEIHDRKGSLGVFAKVKRVDVEVELLRALLRASCALSYTVAVHVYCTEQQRPIPDDVLEKTVLGVTMSFYDGASNGNRTRGGIRKSSEILAAFQSHFPESKSFTEANALIAATHSMSFYSLTLQHGVPFQPVNIRASKDPMSLIGKILEQNPRSYTKLDDLIEIGQSLVRAGLGSHENSEVSATKPGQSMNPSQTQDQELFESSRRVTLMAIEASLSEGDFDTAYSYIVNRLSPTVPNSHPESPPTQPSQEPANQDDVSWRAAYLAGRSTPSKSSPSQLSLRRLEQRMELLSLSLLLAPSSQVPGILQVWRAVESDLTALIAHEAAEEDKWNSKGDRGKTAQGNSTLPGGFAPSAVVMDKVANQRSRRESRATAAAANEEAPMGLFDVARGAAQAFSKNAFPLRGAASATKSHVEGTMRERPLSIGSDIGSDGKGERVRKRDMVANAVTGGLASGIGWVIGAPAPPKS